VQGTNWMSLRLVFGEISPPGTYNWGFGGTYFEGEPLEVTILGTGVAERQDTSSFTRGINTYASNTTVRQAQISSRR